jgi:hypothetical protein
MGPEARIPRVGYLGGEGRSGSTLLERIIELHPRAVAIGELKYLWQVGLGEGGVCGCGDEVARCPFWRAVGTRVFGNSNWPPPNELVPTGSNLPGSFAGLAELVRLLGDRRRRSELERSRRLNQQLYAAIAAVADADVVIDSSKHPFQAAMLAADPAIDMRLIHLVRHPGAVVASWCDPEPRSDGRRTALPVHAPADVALRWRFFNRYFVHLANRVPTITERYEDFIEAPASVVSRCFTHLELEPIMIPRINEGFVELRLGHGIAGNPMRSDEGTIPIRRDDPWRARLPPSHLALARALTVGGLHRYRYSWSAAPRTPTP